MNICAYCKNPAHYIYQINSDISKTYCATHVPNFLRRQRDAGLLPTTPEFADEKAAAFAQINLNNTPAVPSQVEAPEEVAVTTEEQAPKPKARKKSTPSAEELVEAQAEATVEEVIEEEPVVEEAEVVEETPAEGTE